MTWKVRYCTENTHIYHECFDMTDFLHYAVHRDDKNHEIYSLSVMYTNDMSKWILASLEMKDTKVY